MSNEPLPADPVTVFALADRVRAVLRLIAPDHITPMGVRQIERVLNEATTVILPTVPTVAVATSTSTER